MYKSADNNKKRLICLCKRRKIISTFPLDDTHMHAHICTHYKPTFICTSNGKTSKKWICLDEPSTAVQTM